MIAAVCLVANTIVRRYDIVK